MNNVCRFSKSCQIAYFSESLNTLYIKIIYELNVIRNREKNIRFHFFHSFVAITWNVEGKEHIIICASEPTQWTTNVHFVLIVHIGVY